MRSTATEARDFAAALASGDFLITTEEPPPKGVDLGTFRRRIAPLRGVVDGVNVTESSAAVLAMAPVGVVPSLRAAGLEPILQITCRDRNRIALQSDLLAASALGVRTVVAMTGDPIEGGDHPDARPVFDLDTPALLRAAATLTEGRDLAGNALTGAPSFCCGAVVDPGAADIDREVARAELKVAAGASFFQTQAVYDPAVLERFVRRIEALRTPLLTGYIVLKSAAMARRLNATIPGVQIPESLIEALREGDAAPEPAIAVSGRILARLRELCQGLHVIAVGWEAHLPAILAAAGVSRPTE